MSTEIAKQIERFFAENDGEGDFLQYDRSMPYFVIAPPDRGGHIVYATKSGPVSQAFDTLDAHAQIGLFGRYGLPSEDNFSWIAKLVEGKQVWFLGDMDPSDLMIFAWLRARLAPQAVKHLGVNDAYLESLSVSLSDWMLIQLSASEKAALPLLEQVLPDLESIVGSRLAKTLRSSRKLEIEAIVSAKGSVETLLEPLSH